MRGEKGTEQTFDFVLYFLLILCYNSGREWKYNETLAAQFYGEGKKFFSNNAVEYFIFLCSGGGT